MRKKSLVVFFSVVLVVNLFSDVVLNFNADSWLPAQFSSLESEQSQDDAFYDKILSFLLFGNIDESDEFIKEEKKYWLIKPKALFLKDPFLLSLKKIDRKAIEAGTVFSGFNLNYRYSIWADFMSEDDADKNKNDILKDVKGGWRWDISKDIKLILRGSQDINMTYGLDSVEQNLLTGTHARPVGVSQGFKLNQNLNLSLVGKVGPKIRIAINHDTKRAENIYDISYNGKKDEIVKLVKAGNVALKIPSSKYVVYSGGDKTAFGIKMELQSKKFKLQGILSLTKGIAETKYFTGQNSEQKIDIRETAYQKHRYFTTPHYGMDANSVKIYQTTTVTNEGTYINGGYYKLLTPGTEYNINYTTGDLVLMKALTTDSSLLVSYQGGIGYGVGDDSPTPPYQPFEEFTEGTDTYYYLKKVGEYSSFERKSIYHLGYSNIDIGSGFVFYLIKTSDSSRVDSVQFSASEYSFDPALGVIEFNSMKPFTGKPDIGNWLYDSPIDPNSADSVYSLHFEFLHRVDTFQLQFNVISGTEKVSLNNQVLRRGVDYTINYMTGSLTFKRIIQQSDKIEVSYEYKPFAGSLQRTLFGLRGDINIFKGFDLGATMVYSGGQKPTGAPAPQNSPDSKLIFDIDGTLDFIKMFGIDSKKGWKAQIKGEVAYSVHDRNTVSMAIIADMEGDALGYALTRSDSLWKLGSIPTTISNEGSALLPSERGLLLYRDYREYKYDGSFSLNTYNWGLPSSQIYSYATKPGPYSVQGGRNESTTEIIENSLVFEYNFDGGKKWVSAVCSIAGAGGMDLSEVNQLLLSVKHQSYQGDDVQGNAIYTTDVASPIRVYFELGQVSEDADADGLFDAETSISSGGYYFNPPFAGVDSTYIGGGRDNGGNGSFDSEDLNRNNVFDTNESTVTFPNQNMNETNYLIIPGGGDWQEHILFIQQLDTVNRAILQKVSAVRITIVSETTDAKRGRLLIDRAYFKGSRWDLLKVDGIIVKASPAFSATIISTRENSEYKANRLYQEYPDDFEDLHGSLSSSEEGKLNEKALQLKYDFVSSTVTNGTVTKLYNSNMDFGFYKTIIFYMLQKEKSNDPDDYFVFRLGNDSERYYEWKIQLTNVQSADEATASGDKKWKKYRIKLIPDDDSERLHLFTGTTDLGPATLSVKPPNLKEVNRVTVGVIGDNKGELWVNEIHIDDDEKEKGVAYSFSGEISNSKKELLTFLGLPIINGFSIKVNYNKIGLGFISLGQGSSQYAKTIYNSSLSLNLMRFFKITANQTTDSAVTEDDELALPLYLQSQTTNSSYTYSLSFNSRKRYVPVVDHVFSRRITKSLSHSISSDIANPTNDDFILDVVKWSYSENATANVSWALPYGFSTSYKIEDSYHLSDLSMKSNSVSDSWFTNVTTKGSETFKKRESLSAGTSYKRIFGMKRSSFSLKGTLFQEKENNNIDLSQNGMRQKFQDLESKTSLDSYFDRADELFSGIGHISEVDGTNLSAVSKGYTLNMSAKNFGPLTLDVGFTKSLRDANFVITTNLEMVNNNATVAKSTISTKLAFPKFFVRSISAKLTRDFSFSSQTGLERQDEIWDDFRGDFFAFPFYYLGFFGSGGRFNDIDLVQKGNYSFGSSYVKLRNSFSFGGKLDFGKSILKDFIPENYSFSITQDTARSLSSITQSRSWQFSFNKSFSIRKLKFWIFDESTKRGKKVQDLVLSLGMGRKYDYNSKTISNNFSSGLSFGIKWSRYNVLSMSYNIRRTYNYQSINEGDDGYVYMGLGPDTGTGMGDSFGDLEELSDGLAPLYTPVPPLEKMSHMIKLNFTFPTYHKPEIKLFGMVIKMDRRWRHSNLLLLNLTDSEYGKDDAGKYSFSELFDKVFYLKLQHSIDYDFSKSWNGNFYITTVFEQWRLITPIDGGTVLEEEKFRLSFGLEFGIKMRIRF